MATDQFSYSYDEERFHGEFNSRDEALTVAKQENPQYATFWVGRIKEIPMKSILPDACWLIDHMQEQAHDICGEASEDFLSCISRENVNELTADIHAAVMAWMERHNELPHFWNVEDVEEHTISVPET